MQYIWDAVGKVDSISYKGAELFEGSYLQPRLFHYLDNEVVGRVNGSNNTFMVNRAYCIGQ